MQKIFFTDLGRGSSLIECLYKYLYVMCLAVASVDTTLHWVNCIAVLSVCGDYASLHVTV